MIGHAPYEIAELERLASRWIAKGYRLIASPRGSELPAFLASYRPDAILLAPPGSDHRGILVEVLFKGQSDTLGKIESLRSALRTHPEWRFEVLYAGVPPRQLDPPSVDRLRAFLDDIESTDDHDPGAFLLLWPVLEASARILEPAATRSPQTPGRVVELLASAGHVGSSEADTLRRSAEVRNRLIHGDLNVEVPVDLRRETERIARELVAGLVPNQHSLPI